MKEVEDKSGTIDGVKYVRPWRPPVNGVKKKEDAGESQEISLENGSSEKVTSQEASPENVEETPEKETRCQFNQHFTCAFFIQKSFWQLFSSYL